MVGKKIYSKGRMVISYKSSFYNNKNLTNYNMNNCYNYYVNNYSLEAFSLNIKRKLYNYVITEINKEINRQLIEEKKIFYLGSNLGYLSLEKMRRTEGNYKIDHVKNKQYKGASKRVYIRYDTLYTLSWMNKYRKPMTRYYRFAPSLANRNRIYKKVLDSSIIF